MKPVAKIGLYVRARRKSMGVSIPALALVSGVQKSTISKLENGIGNPSLDTIMALAGGLKITVYTMLKVSLSERK